MLRKGDTKFACRFLNLTDVYFVAVLVYFTITGTCALLLYKLPI